MSTETQKREFATLVRDKITAIAQAADSGDDAVTVYFDRTYGSGGADEITNDHLATLGITAADLSGAITFFQNLNKLLNNEEPTTADYDLTLNKMRNDW